MSAKKILITGATGKQGGALIGALLNAKSPIKIYALTRNARSPSAQALAARSKTITLVEGAPQNPQPIFAQFPPRSIWGVFSVTVPGSDEESQAKPLIDAAVAAGVQHFVFTSVDRGGPARSDGDDPTPVPHFITKFNVERHLREKAASSPQGMVWTILRPVAFFDNLTPDLIGRSFARMVQQLGGRKLAMVGTRDIGVVAARAFLDPEGSKFKAYTLAADSLDFESMSRIFKEEVGYDLPMAPGFLATLFKYFVSDLGKMFQWFGEGNYSYDIEAVKAEHSGLQDFRTWLRTESKFETKK